MEPTVKDIPVLVYGYVIIQ